MGRCRSYRYLLQPTARQRSALEGLLRSQCELYSAALEERRGAWKWERRSVSYVGQCRTLTELRAVRPDTLEHGVTVCRGTLQRLDRVAQAHRSIRNQRRDLAHKLSRALVDGHDLIAHEDLRLAGMVRRPEPRPTEDGSYMPNGAASKAGLNRSIHDAGWGQLLSFIAYKAESAGRVVIAVDPRHTSQRCAHCGYIAAHNRLSQAEFRCVACGHTAHADVNAAINILRAGRAQQASACAGSRK